MRIVIAVDFGLYGEAQVRFMRDGFANQNSEVTVLHVIEPLYWELQTTYPAMMPLSDTIIKQKRDSAEQLVNDVAEQLKSCCGNVSIATRIREGSVANEIIAAADEFKADLLIVGSHGKNGLERFLLGSVSQAISAHANCSVLIARRL